MALFSEMMDEVGDLKSELFQLRKVLAEKDRALEEAAQRLEARGHNFGAEMARLAITNGTRGGEA